MDVEITAADVADAMHLDGVADLPTGYEFDIESAEQLVEDQVAPYADPNDASVVEKTAVFVAAAFVAGAEGDRAVEQIQRETQTIVYDTDGDSDEAVDYWARAVTFDPTGRLGTDTTGADFEVF